MEEHTLAVGTPFNNESVVRKATTQRPKGGVLCRTFSKHVTLCGRTHVGRNYYVIKQEMCTAYFVARRWCNEVQLVMARRRLCWMQHLVQFPALDKHARLAMA